MGNHNIKTVRHNKTFYVSNSFGEDEKIKSENDEAEGIIPALDQELARWLQTELLKRADIQKTIQINGTPE